MLKRAIPGIRYTTYCRDTKGLSLRYYDKIVQLIGYLTILEIKSITVPYNLHNQDSVLPAILN